MNLTKGQRVRLKYFPHVTGTVMENKNGDHRLISATVLVRVDQPVLDMAAGDTAPIALCELILDEAKNGN